MHWRGGPGCATGTVVHLIFLVMSCLGNSFQHLHLPALGRGWRTQVWQERVLQEFRVGTVQVLVVVFIGEEGLGCHRWEARCHMSSLLVCELAWSPHLAVAGYLCDVTGCLAGHQPGLRHLPLSRGTCVVQTATYGFDDWPHAVPTYILSACTCL